MDQATGREYEMVAAAQAGAPGAFAELYSTYSRRLYKAILLITKNPEDAEDALQDTFMRAHVAIRTFERRASIYSWLTRIAINSALMILRKRRARAEILFDPLPDLTETCCFEVKDPAPGPEQIFDLRQRHVMLSRAIYSLRAELRGPLRMQISKGASMKEISRALNISEGAVKARLHRARLRLSDACREGQLADFRRDSRRRGRTLRPDSVSVGHSSPICQRAADAPSQSQ